MKGPADAGDPAGNCQTWNAERVVELVVEARDMQIEEALAPILGIEKHRESKPLALRSRQRLQCST